MIDLIAKCHFSNDNDDSNVCTLSKEYLHVRKSDKLESFPLDIIHSISFKQKMLLFPIIFGGILSPLALLALSNDLFHFWITMTFAIVGMLSIYYGFVGMKALSITTSVKEYDFFLKEPPSVQLRSFVRLTAKFIYTREINYYFLLSPDEWHKFKANGVLQKSPLFLRESLPGSENSEIILALNPVSESIEIVYLPSDGNLNNLLPQTTSRIGLGDIYEMDGLD